MILIGFEFHLYTFLATKAANPVIVKNRSIKTTAQPAFEC